ncbi:hypothetical protein [Aquimarina longa]|uniref:hypothetical protein n=1 Tax=Aquimarina longa TaxID=1080221 RepID=UPI0011DF9321|nr:hypothetical protein [Aquimarina longa]
MKHRKIKFQEFLIDNGISKYHLKQVIKKKIIDFHERSLDLQSIDYNLKDDQQKKVFLEVMDIELLTAIRNNLIQKIKRTTTSDVEILEALKRIKWTKHIWESDLKSMGLQASLSWNTTILGTLKLTRISTHIPCYQLISIGENFKSQDRKNKTSKKKNAKKLAETL